MFSYTSFHFNSFNVRQSGDLAWGEINESFNRVIFSIVSIKFNKQNTSDNGYLSCLLTWFNTSSSPLITVLPNLSEFREHIESNNLSYYIAFKFSLTSPLSELGTTWFSHPLVHLMVRKIDELHNIRMWEPFYLRYLAFSSVQMWYYGTSVVQRLLLWYRKLRLRILEVIRQNSCISCGLLSTVFNGALTRCQRT